MTDTGQIPVYCSETHPASDPMTGKGPDKQTDKRDRRIERTRRTLREALIALILERGWDDISVQDVCNRADVGRSTFYTHFADKEELLVGGFDDLRKVLRGSLATMAAHSPEPLQCAA
jgi:AcrR family transcriptional regulator